MENFSRTGEYLERLRKVSINSDVWFANPLEEKEDFLGSTQEEPEKGPMDYASYRSNLLNGWKEGQKNKEEYDSQLMPSFYDSGFTDSILSPLTVHKVVFPDSLDETILVPKYGETPVQPTMDVHPLKDSWSSESGNEAIPVPDQTQKVEQVKNLVQNQIQNQNQVQNPVQNQTQSQDQVQTQVSDSVRNNPFARMMQKASGIQENCKMKDFQNINGWFASGRCFGILGMTLGGVLTAFSLLSSAGSHPMTALGISLISAGIFMFASVGFLSAFQNLKERV